jgi:hypothetical protein
MKRKEYVLCSRVNDTKQRLAWLVYQGERLLGGIWLLPSTEKRAKQLIQRQRDKRLARLRKR